MPKLFPKFITIKGVYNMKYIAVGTLVVDCYYKDNQFLGRMNGKTFQNIGINLKHLGQDVKIVGSVGNDETGDFALKNLNKLGIETEIKRVSKPTNRIFIVDNKHQKEWEGIRYWYEEKEKYDIKVKKEDIVIVDNVNKNTRESIKNLSCEKVLDLGYATNFLYLKKDKIMEIFSGLFSIINMNERAYNLLKGKLKLEAQEMCKCFHLKLLIVTYGKKGISFYTPKLKKEYKIKEPFKEVDPSGAGDAFFAIILNEYNKNKRKINEYFLENCFQKGNEYVKVVVENNGALSHILHLEE